MNDTRKIWARIGMEFHITQGEETVLFGDNIPAAEEVIKTLISSGRFHLTGESYIPAVCVENFNDEYGTAYAAKDFDFDL